MTPPIAVSTFSGAGGSSLGYERAGFDVRVAVDNAPDGFSDALVGTYRANHPDTVLLERDVRDVDADDIFAAAGTDDIALLDGSPPCSPFSSANSRVEWRKHDSNTLFDEYLRLVDEIRPAIALAENVPNLATGKARGYYNVLLDRFRACGPGYRLRVQRIDAAYLGAPQHRDRLMFQAVRSDIADEPPPPVAPTNRPKTVNEAWDGLDRDPDAVDAAREILRSSDNYAAYKRIAPGETLDDVIGRGWTHYRLSPNEPAKTFTAHMYALPPDDDRVITIGETKRLLSLPDDYEITAPGWSQAFECCVRCLPPILNETVARNAADAAGIDINPTSSKAEQAGEAQ